MTVALVPAPTSSCRTSSTVLRHEPPASARRHTRQSLHHWHLHDPVFGAVELVVSELVTNALVHADSRSIGLCLTLERDTVLVEVTDDSPAGPQSPELPGTEAESGRGLCIVASLAAEYGRNTDGPRAVSWARIPREGQ